MPNLSEAIAEAYASAPSHVVLLHTLEIRHPAFIDEQGNAAPIRVVRDHADLFATLEATAPANAGQQVRFVSFAFDITLPPVNDKSIPEVAITIDNVSLDIVKNIERAVESQQVIMVTYRPFLSTDLSGPQFDPPMHLVLSDIVVDVFKVKARASLPNLSNKSFPSALYTATKFPGLAR